VSTSPLPYSRSITAHRLGFSGHHGGVSADVVVMGLPRANGTAAVVPQGLGCGVGWLRRQRRRFPVRACFTAYCFCLVQGLLLSSLPVFRLDVLSCFQPGFVDVHKG